MAVKRIVSLPPIEFDAETTDGKIIRLTARNLRIDEFQAIDEFDKEEDKKMVLLKKLAYIFGGNPEDYLKFNIDVAIMVFQSYLEEIRNPTRQRQES